ncbi:sterol desaturase family protein [Paraburkholderia dinghuensis]|nr:sterol desaturase family protein [Paraburkholderia dinghuensis]
MNYLESLREIIFPAKIFGAEALGALGWILLGQILIMIIMNYVAQSRIFRSGRIFDVPIPARQRRREFIHSWHVFLDSIVLYIFLYTGLLRPSVFTWPDTLITFLIFVVWVEVYFYCVHWAMHSFKWLRPIHREHHRSVVNTPYSGFASSMSEKVVLLSLATCFMAALSWFMNITMSGIAAFYAYYYVIVIGGHCNTEFPFISRTMQRLGLATPSVHALHHARFNVNYGFSFVFLDRLFGTYTSETDTLRDRALAGNGYQSLKRPKGV